MLSALNTIFDFLSLLNAFTFRPIALSKALSSHLICQLSALAIGVVVPSREINILKVRMKGTIQIKQKTGLLKS